MELARGSVAADGGPSAGTADVALASTERWKEFLYAAGLAFSVDASNWLHVLWTRNKRRDEAKCKVCVEACPCRGQHHKPQNENNIYFYVVNKLAVQRALAGLLPRAEDITRSAPVDVLRHDVCCVRTILFPPKS